MWESFFMPGRRQRPVLLVSQTVGACGILFCLLQLWRPCYFLTDDNLSATFPFLTEVGRHLKTGESPFHSDYLFGGHYNYLRDLGIIGWHPFTLLPSLLADTALRFWIIDIPALLLLVLATLGFTLLASALRNELSLPIPDAYLFLYTLSFVFGTYTLTIGPSWINFLGNLSALPWLTLALLDRNVARSTFLIFLFTLHEFLIAYPPLTITSGIFLTLFGLGVAWWRRSSHPLFCWAAGNVLTLAALLPYLLGVLDGFVHSDRVHPLPPLELLKFTIPAGTFPFSFFMGNWMEPIARWQGDTSLSTLEYPYVSSLLACLAAWCLIPALILPMRWRALEKASLVIVGILFVWIIRPPWLAHLMFHLPFFRSMRWPFREAVLFLFFVHLLLIMRFPVNYPRWQAVFTGISLVMFLAPLPWVRPFSLNTLALDRQYLFSGQAERFWTGVKTKLKPTDEIATVIDHSFWKKNSSDIPYTLLGTANYPELFQVRSASGYSPTAPQDQIPLKAFPLYWFGGFGEDQVASMLADQPGLKLIRIASTRPLKITMSDGTAPPVDLSPFLQAAQKPDSTPGTHAVGGP